MPMIITYTFVPFAIIYASRFNTNFSDVKNWADLHEITTTGIHGVGAGFIVGTTLVQTLTNKTFGDNLQWQSGTAHLGILDHSNTADRTYTYPDASGNVPSLPTPATTETGTGAIVRQNNPTIEAPTIHDGNFTGNSVFTGTVVLPSGGTPQLCPIGTVVAFLDYGGLLTFDTNYWRYMDGAVLAYPASPLNGQTLEDCSGRYLVGFGTDGGGNIGTAPWAVGAVGNANHQINIAHTHDMQNHTHSIGSHTHSISSDNHNHYNNAGGVGFTHHIADNDNPYQTDYSYHAKDDSMGWGSFAIRSDAAPSANEGEHDHYIDNYTHAHGGVTGGTSASTGTPSTNTTSSALSATQSIQPSSIRCRMIIRVL